MNKSLMNDIPDIGPFEHAPFWKGFPLTWQLKNNAVFVIECLPESEWTPDRNIGHQLKDLRNQGIGRDRYLVHFRVRNAGDVRSVLEGIAAFARQVELNPILHFNAHGDKTRGLEVGPDRELVSWDLLRDLLRRINVACRGNLGVVMATCYGFRLVEGIKIRLPAPFNFLVGSVEKPTEGYLDKQMPQFYQMFFETGNLAAALNHLADARVGNSPTPLFLFFQAENQLVESFLRWYDAECSPSGRDARTNELLTRMKWARGLYRRGEIAEVRRVAKRITSLEHSIRTYARYSSAFLAGRTRSFAFEDVIAWAHRLETTKKRVRNPQSR